MRIDLRVAILLAIYPSLDFIRRRDSDTFL